MGALRRSFLRIAIITAVIWAGLRPVITSAQGAQDNMRFGLVNAYSDPDAADASGAGWEIVTLHWDQIQPNSPSDWNPDTKLDEWLATARTQGREIVAVVIGTPAWASNGDAITGVPRGLYLPISDAGNNWAGFIKRAASYYGAKGINRWVIWEDLDIPANRDTSTWDGSIEEYYQLVKVAYLSTREANPNALTHLGGVGQNDPNWFSRFMDIVLDDPTGPANNYYFDVATLHVFYSPDQIYTLTRNHFFVMNSKGIPLKEVWVNETNARPAEDTEVYPDDQTFRQHPNVTLEEQAAFMIQSYALAFAANKGARMAVYQLSDDLEADDNEAFGLVRADKSQRQAFSTYRLAAEQFNGFVFARRIEETHPLMDYVRLTYQNKVTHITWAITRTNATLVIPARTTQAVLIDMYGNQWTVQPQDGNYRVAAAGAACNDPQNGCLIGGAPWILIEDGIADAVNGEAPPILVEEGGTPPTPDPSMALTATAAAMPTDMPTVAPTEAPPVTEELTTEATAEIAATQEQTAVAEVVEPISTEVIKTTSQAPAGPDRSALGPHGIAAVLPYLLMGLGVLVIGAGGWYYFIGHRQMADNTDLDFLKATQVNERIEFSGEIDEALFSTAKHPYPDLPDEDEHTQATQTTARPELPDEVGSDEGYSEEEYSDDEYFKDEHTRATQTMERPELPDEVESDKGYSEEEYPDDEYADDDWDEEQG